MSTDILALLESACTADGLSVVRHPNHLAVEGDRLLLKAGYEVKPSPTQRPVATLQLQAYSAALGNRPIVETFAGAGGSPEEALNDAVGKALMGTFPVLVGALTGHTSPQGPSSIARWGRKDAAWQVHSGPLLAQHHDGFTLNEGYPAFLESLSRRFLETAPPGPHWIRVFIACFNGQLQASEVLLDNEPWEAGHKLVLAQRWSTTQAFQSIRQFMLAVPAQGK